MAAVAGSGSAAADPPPLVGANYTHYSITGCSLQGTGIVAGYDKDGVRETVRAQLAAMRASGMASLRLVLWHTSEITGREWGVVPSAGGELPEPYRSNLATYLTDVREAGFEQLTVAFAPAAANDPRAKSYDATRFEENWRFLENVRPLIKRYGPPSTHIDLINEGAPRARYRRWSAGAR